MKKVILGAMLLLSLLGIAGCTNKDISIITEEVSVNTFVAKANGQLQVATVEEFDKDYYNLKELTEFVAKEIDLYNQKAGGNKITMDDLQKKNGKAIMLLSYSDMGQYTAFNNVTAAYFNGGITDISLDLPSSLVSAKEGNATDTMEVLSNQKYKILVMYEPYDIIVDGKVVFYSDNAVLVDKNKVQSSAEGATVIVFKP